MGTVVIVGQSLHPVRVTGEQATDRPHPDDATRTIIGTPVSINGANLRRFPDVAPTIVAALRAETDPTKRAALLTNVKGRALKGARVSVRRDVMAALVAECVSAVAKDPEKPTEADRRAGAAYLQAQFDAGLVILPSVDAADADDALAFMFDLADGEADA